MTAQEETRDFYAVIDLLADKVGRQLKTHFGKVKTKKCAHLRGEVLSEAEEIAPSLVTMPET